MKKPLRLTLAQIICRYLPPLISQRAREFIYPRQRAYSDAYTFLVRSQTGSTFTNITSDFHAYPFAVHGYFNWRAWAIALAVCNRGDRIVEIGANIGTETVGFADIVGHNGHVFAFEPLPQNINVLTSIIRQSTYDNITLFPMALGDKVGKISFSVPNNVHSSGTGFVVNQNTTPNTALIEVECSRLDELKSKVGTVRLVFMDVEGSEYHVLKGGRELIKSSKPLIVLEAGPKQLERQNLTLHDLYEELKGLDYRVFDIGRFDLKEVEPHNFPVSTKNWLCIPKTETKALTHRISFFLWRCGLMPCIPFLNPMTSVV